MSRTRIVRRAALVGIVALLAGLTAVPAGAQTGTTTTTGAEPSTTTTPSTPTTTTPSTTAPASASSPASPTTTTTTPTSGTTIPAEPVSAVTSAVTVTPSTGLGYIQEIAINGNGFSPHTQLGFAECETGRSSAEGCDLSTVQFATTDDNGAFSGTITVHRFLHNTHSGTVDCATAPATCNVGAGRLDGTDGADTPLAFDPAAPIPPPPTITADPDSDLGLVTSVHVTGSGFQPGGPVVLPTCKHGSTDLRDCSAGFSGFALADGNGNIDTTVEVHRGIRTQNASVIDCLDAPGCDLAAFNTTDPDRRGIAPLEYDAAIAAPPPLDVTVVPDTDLADNTIAAVTVTGLEPFEGAVLTQCLAGTSAPADCAPAQYANADDAGTINMVLRLRRSIGPEGSPIDCASGSGACELSVIGFEDPFDHGAAPLDFDPDAPPVPGPSLTVVPDADLVHKQVVTITGTGFLPNTFVNVFECTHDRGCGFGRPSTFMATDGDGNVETQLAVHRGLRMLDGTVFDCTEPPGCDVLAVELVDGDEGAGAFAVEPIGFDVSVPPPSPRPVSVDPPGPYADHQIVQVSSAGFQPGETVFLLQCAGSGAAVNQCLGIRTAPVAADGTVSASMRVRRSFDVFDNLEAAIAGTGTAENADVGAAATVDCAVDECSIVVFSFEDAYAIGATPLVIDPNLAPAPPPTFVAEPTAELLDGQVLTVHGSGFSPDAEVAMIQCRAGSDDDTGQACDISKTLRYATADHDGDIETTFTVTRVLDTSRFGPVDCATVPEGCILGWAGTADVAFERGNVPLDFLGDVFVGGVSETAPSVTGPGGLPRTGSNSARLALWGALAVVAGLGLRAASRRRRRRADAVPDDVDVS